MTLSDLSLDAFCTLYRKFLFDTRNEIAKEDARASEFGEGPQELPLYEWYDTFKGAMEGYDWEEALKEVQKYADLEIVEILKGEEG